MTGTDAEYQAQHPTEPEDEKHMGFLDHLGELRKRIMLCLVVLVPAAALGGLVTPQVLDWLTVQGRAMITARKIEAEQSSTPVSLGGVGVTPFGIFPVYFISQQQELAKLHVLSPTEGIMAYFKIALVIGLFVAFPLIITQIWLFVSPGLYRRERRAILPFLLSGWLVFIAGGAFGYFVIMKYALYMLAGIGAGNYEMTWSLSRYINFALMTMVVFGLIFELPVLSTLLTRLGVLQPRVLVTYRRYAIVLMALIAALLTPPDPFTMLLMLGPLIVLYEISILTSRLAMRSLREPQLPR